MNHNASSLRTTRMATRTAPGVADRGTAGIALARLMLDVADELGIDREALRQRAGISEQAWAQMRANGTARMPMADLLALFASVQGLTARPALAVDLAQRVRPATFSVLGYALMTCRTLGEAIDLIPHYRRLVFDSAYSETSVVIEGNSARLSWHVLADSGLPYSPLLAEVLMTSWVAFARWMSGQNLPLIAVCFAHDAAGADAHERYQTFFACPVTFACAENSLIFDPALLRQTLPHADLDLHLAMRQQARTALAGMTGQSRDSVVAEVRRSLLPLMPRCEATLTHVARALGVPPRTLQRKLAESGAGFQQVLDAARRELAEIYLKDMSISVLDVALLLGYAEQSSFTRAFRTWFGRSPSAWRIIAGEGLRLRA